MAPPAAPPSQAPAYGLRQFDPGAPAFQGPPALDVRPPTAPPAFDMRPAQGYSYQYKDPTAPGAAPGTQFGPMAQDLEKTAAGAFAVGNGPTGQKYVDPGRLSMVNAAGLGEQQRRLDAQGQALQQMQAFLARNRRAA